MEKRAFNVGTDGFHGAWFPNSAAPGSTRGIILMLGDSADDYMAKCGARWLYEHGTHFAFPESLLKMMLPVGSGLLVSAMFRAGKERPKECRQTRLDIDARLKAALAAW